MISEAAIGSLTVKQSKLGAGWHPPKTYDFFLAALSWEQRSISLLTLLHEKTPPVHLMKFKSSNTGIETKKEAHLHTIKAHTEVACVIELQRSTQTQPNFSAIEEWLKNKYVEVGRPIRLLLDITCIPKSYLLFLIGLGFSRDYLACVDCVYAAGTYDLNCEPPESINEIRTARSLVSDGEWRSELIPYLTASEYLPSDRDLTVAFGGEIGLALPFIERVEPSRLELIFIDETAPKNDGTMLASESKALNDLMAEPNTARLDIRLADIIGLAEHVVGYARSSKSSVTTAMAIGCKPHALALAIAALAEPKLGIVTRIPTAYKEIDVQASGQFYFFQIEDRFEPANYIDSL